MPGADLEIDYMNQKRGIQLELSGAEELLYSYTQSVTRKQLVAICEKPVADMPAIPQSIELSTPARQEENYDINDLLMGMSKS